MTRMPILISVVCFLSAAPAAAGTDDLIPSLRTCKAIGEDKARLACLDGVLETLELATDTTALDDQADPQVPALANASSAVEEPEPEAEVPEETAEFGAEDIKTKQASKKTKRPNLLNATLIELATNKSGKYVMILDNGQVWRQLQSDTGRLSIGKKEANLPVTIKRRSLGGYSFSLERDRRSVRVERLK
ncbi:MAG: hypothetical protein AAGJ73_06110 [Pseudomonadota bacterium]